MWVEEAVEDGVAEGGIAHDRAPVKIPRRVGSRRFGSDHPVSGPILEHRCGKLGAEGGYNIPLASRDVHHPSSPALTERAADLRAASTISEANAEERFVADSLALVEGPAPSCRCTGTHDFLSMLERRGYTADFAAKAPNRRQITLFP